MTINHSDANLSNKQPHETKNEANQDTPGIECHDNGGGNMTCRWTDNEGNEHALYYNKQTEFLRFNRENKQWVALLKNAEDSLAPRAAKTTPDRAERGGFNVQTQERDLQRCIGLSYGLCPEIDSDGTTYTYTWNGEKIVIDSTKEVLAWSEADNKFLPVLKNLDP